MLSVLAITLLFTVESLIGLVLPTQFIYNIVQCTCSYFTTGQHCNFLKAVVKQPAKQACDMQFNKNHETQRFSVHKSFLEHPLITTRCLSELVILHSSTIFNFLVPQSFEGFLWCCKIRTLNLLRAFMFLCSGQCWISYNICHNLRQFTVSEETLKI